MKKVMWKTRSVIIVNFQKDRCSIACFSLHNGKHRYSTQPRYAKAVVQVKLTAGEVIVMNESFQQIIRHPRLYLTQLSKRPTALKHSGIYQLFPEPVRTYLDGLEREEKKEILKTTAALSTETSFHKAEIIIFDEWVGRLIPRFLAI